jgi:hypothetical protein
MGTLRELVDGGSVEQGQSLTPPESISEPPPWSEPRADARPWDDWSGRATAAGVPDELVALGTELIRASVLQAWSEELRAECGHYDEGEAMVDLALAKPDQAAQRWGALLEFDGRV